MAAQPSSPSAVSDLVATHRSLIQTMTSFLIVATHHILFLRGIYPPISFLSCRAYNFPVRQNRHPAVCQWILEAMAAVRDQLEKNTIEKIAICIFESEQNRVLERWSFDLRNFPVVLPTDGDTAFESTTTAEDSDQPEANQGLFSDPLQRTKANLIELEAQFRAVLSRISTSASKLKPLPEGPDAPNLSFTITMDVKDAADRPVRRLDMEERKWIAAETDVFEPPPSRVKSSDPLDGEPAATPNALSEKDSKNQKQSAATAAAKEGRTTPVRRLETGELRMEVWVEESTAKFEYNTVGQVKTRTVLKPGPNTKLDEPKVASLSKKNE